MPTPPPPTPPRPTRTPTPYTLKVDLIKNEKDANDRGFVDGYKAALRDLEKVLKELNAKVEAT